MGGCLPFCPDYFIFFVDTRYVFCYNHTITAQRELHLVNLTNKSEVTRLRLMLHFPDVDRIPDHPALPVPPLHALNEQFRQALMNPQNKILRRDEHGNPIFGAYIGSDSNELITWAIITLGEWFSGRDASWLTSTFPTFFSEEAQVYMNGPHAVEIEFWYLFYVNTLCGAMQQVFFPQDEAVRRRFATSADSLVRMAKALHYDFNQQSFHFLRMQPITHKPQYRQPDSIGGYAYNMLFAALHADRPQYMEESLHAIRLYEQMPANPWYEIPNDSAALMAAAWLDAHGHPRDIARIAGWLFDHEHGPLQIGKWGNEEVDGLMMGWFGDTRAQAMASAYSMETFMPIQFFLPAVRYCPQLADAVGKYIRCMLSNFQLFYARGSEPLYETKPELDASIPYERLDFERDGHTPAACGDFFGHRSIYGSGYLMWLEALACATSNADIFALDCSLTDWLADERYPVFLLRNPFGDARTVTFSPAPIWQQLQPTLFRDGRLYAQQYNLESRESCIADEHVICTIPAKSCLLVALLPEGKEPVVHGNMLTCGQAELCRVL